MEGPHPQLSVPSSDFDVLIALRKGKRSCTDHPISHFVSYDRLTLSFRQFAMPLSSLSLLTSYEEAMLIPVWKQTMDEEMDAIISRGTWELVSVPKDVVGYRWVYTLKYRPDDSVDRNKARLIAKGYTQTYGTLRLFHQLLG